MFLALTIQGEASVQSYQEVLRQVTFAITAAEPDTVDRTICFFVYDGEHMSTPTCVALKISVINDNTPFLSGTALGELYIEGSNGVVLLERMMIVDDDHPNVFPMQWATVSYYERGRENIEWH